MLQQFIKKNESADRKMVVTSICSRQRKDEDDDTDFCCRRYNRTWRISEKVPHGDVHGLVVWTFATTTATTPHPTIEERTRCLCRLTISTNSNNQNPRKTHMHTNL